MTVFAPGAAEAATIQDLGFESSVDPVTGALHGSVAVSAPAEVEAAAALAHAAAPVVAAASPAERAAWLHAIADAIEGAADDLADLADGETALGRARLDGEVLRAAGQLRFYADVAVEGSWLGVAIDHATDSSPDLRRLQVALGPVAVFGASNFPFAFGALGNDTASALAAGCPVVVKTHPAHPLTSARLIELAVAALTECGAPEGTLGSVTGFAAGSHLVTAPEISAVAFTGSQAGGMALWRLAQTRDVVIPVLAEMGTVNPVVVTSAGAADLPGLASGCVESFTLGTGQFCTKPGLLLVPAGSGVAQAVAEALLAAEPSGAMLTWGMVQSYDAGVTALKEAGAVMLAGVPLPASGDGPANAVSAVVMSADAALLHPGSPLLEECFGPVTVVVEYGDAEHLGQLVGQLQGCLVAAVQTGGADDEESRAAVAQLARIAGRVVVDGWPTGVSYTWAQQHGGPWPATTTPGTTSVGAAALERFTRPVAYQNTPQGSLPPAVQEKNHWKVTRRVDGKLRPRRAT
jgi:NADP-dependent aldehyde dehydrogenase